MTAALMKKFLVLALPALLIAAAFAALPRIPALPPLRQELVPFIPYLVVVPGLFLAFHFRRGRAFLAMLAIILYYRGMSWFVQPTPEVALAFHAANFLLPLDLALFALMRERGVFTSAGRMRLVFLLLQLPAIGWFVRYSSHYPRVVDFLTTDLFRRPLPESIHLGQAPAVATALSLCVIAMKGTLRSGVSAPGFLGAAAAAAIAGNSLALPLAPAVFITAGALALTLSVLEDSYNLAYRDDLTGLPSRRALNERLGALGRRYVIAMLDVDHFKRFNDTYGHDVGDQVLRMVAARMESVGGGGKAYRYGGEEFTVVFPRRRHADVLPHLEELRERIAGYQLRIRGEDRPKKGGEENRRRGSYRDGTTVSVTVSIGVAESCDSFRNAAEVVKAADKALYRAKQRGRNQVCR